MCMLVSRHVQMRLSTKQTTQCRQQLHKADADSAEQQGVQECGVGWGRGKGEGGGGKGELTSSDGDPECVQ